MRIEDEVLQQIVLSGKNTMKKMKLLLRYDFCDDDGVIQTDEIHQDLKTLFNMETQILQKLSALHLV